MTDVYTRIIPEFQKSGQRLGRHVAHDPRSRDFPAEQASAIVDVDHGGDGLPLLQSRGSCTAEALCGALDCNPDFKGRVFTQADADALYNQEIIAEGGNPATDDPGGTGLLVCKCAKAEGLISSYTHTFSFEQMLRALVIRPVIIGVDWYESFDNPDSNGIIESISGTIRGGHEICVKQIITEKALVGVWQSWGMQYGIGGLFYFPYKIVETLLAQQGDCTVPVV